MYVAGVSFDGAVIRSFEDFRSFKITLKLLFETFLNTNRLPSNSKKNLKICEGKYLMLNVANTVNSEIMPTLLLMQVKVMAC